MHWHRTKLCYTKITEKKIEKEQVKGDIPVSIIAYVGLDIYVTLMTANTAAWYFQEFI